MIEIVPNDFQMQRCGFDLILNRSLAQIKLELEFFMYVFRLNFSRHKLSSFRIEILRVSFSTKTTTTNKEMSRETKR